MISKINPLFPIMASIMASVAAGDKFGSFHEFSARLKQYEKEKIGPILREKL